MYTSDMKNVLNLAVEAKRSCRWADMISCPLIANVIKNNIISSVMHIIVCLPKTEYRMNRLLCLVLRHSC